MKQEQLFSKKELRLKLAGARGPFTKIVKAYVRGRVAQVKAVRSSSKKPTQMELFT